jgi:hypothetical protein
VAAAADRDLEAGLSREPQHRGHILGRRATGDQRRGAVDRSVPDPPVLVVGRILGPDQLSAEGSRRDG